MPKRHMEDGKWYELNPPSNIGGKIFSHVMCEYQVPDSPNEYVVRGVPEGETKEGSFLLIFTDRGVTVTPSEPPDKAPKLRNRI